MTIAIIGFYLAFHSSNSLAATPNNFIFIKVNDQAITYSEVLDRTNLALTVSNINALTNQDKYLAIQQISQKMIEEELIRQEASKYNIMVSEEELNQAIEIFQIKQNKSLKELKSFLRKNNISYKSLINQIKSEIIWSKIISQLIRPKISVSEFEIREFLEQKQVDLESKEYLLKQIIITNSQNSQKIADKLYLELENGANFDDLTNQFSNFVITNENNIWLSKNDMNPDLYNSISSLAIGEYSKPLKFDDKLLIIKLVDIKSQNSISKKDHIWAEQYMLNQKLEIMALGYIKDLKQKSFIEIEFRK